MRYQIQRVHESCVTVGGNTDMSCELAALLGGLMSWKEGQDCQYYLLNFGTTQQTLARVSRQLYSAQSTAQSLLSFKQAHHVAAG